jgi:hypothetical protein
MKKYFVSFASSNLKKSAKRIERQAAELCVFDGVYILDESDLTPDFTMRFKDYLKFDIRGYGYWCWKPQIILQILNKMRDGDILQYADVGCHLNINGLSRLEDYFKAAKDARTGILAFQAKPPECPFNYDGRNLLDLKDEKYIKGDVLEYFNVREIDEITKTQTIGAGVIFVRKCSDSMRIIQCWLDVIKTDFSLLDDTPSVTSNMPAFIEHRHDQALFSIICKLNFVETFSAYEYWYPRKNSLLPDWKALVKFPIQARRDLDYGFCKNLMLNAVRLGRVPNRLMRRLISHKID